MSCRIEGERRYPLVDGRVISVIIRNQIAVEDPYLLLARAKAYYIRTGEYDASLTSRSIKNKLIKTNISI